MCQETENQNCISEELVKPLSQIFCWLSDSLAEHVLAKMPGILPDFETQNKKNIAFYRKYGIIVADESTVPGTGVKTWAMVRKKQGK